MEIEKPFLTLRKVSRQGKVFYSRPPSTSRKVEDEMKAEKKWSDPMFRSRCFRANAIPGRLVMETDGFSGVLDEQHEQDVVLVLAGIHAAAQFISGCPEKTVEFGFLNRHNLAVISIAPHDLLRRRIRFSLREIIQFSKDKKSSMEPLARREN